MSIRWVGKVAAYPSIIVKQKVSMGIWMDRELGG